MNRDLITNIFVLKIIKILINLCGKRKILLLIFNLSISLSKMKEDNLAIVLTYCHLDKIPVSSGLGDLVCDGAAGCTKKDQLFRIEMDHVEEGL